MNLRPKRLKITLHRTHYGGILIHTIWRKLLTSAHSYDSFPLKRVQESLGFGNVVLMIDIKNLVYRISFKTESLLNKLTLEIAHTAHSCIKTMVKYIKSPTVQTINPSRNEMVAGLSCIMESRHKHSADSSFCRQTAFVFISIHPYPQRFFVIDVWSYSHTPVNVGCIYKMRYVFLEFRFMENSIYCRQTKTPTPKIRRYGVKTVHRTRRGLHHQTQWNWQIQCFQMLTHFRTILIYDCNDFGCTTIHKNA